MNASAWNSPENLVLLNSRLPRVDAESLRAILKSSVRAMELRGHVFLLTSGTSSGFKWVALSKSAILSAAEAANRHLESDSRDTWLHCLPEFHVGGLSIWARSALSGARVVRSACADSWDPELFSREALERAATLCSLVPAQVHDLVTRELKGPSSLRGILLGGGASSNDLVARARALGWPVLPTYGMSEAASQVATAPLEAGNSRESSECLRVLPHLEVSTGDDQRIRVRGSSLFSGYVLSDAERGGTFVDPRENGWFVTDDFGKAEDGFLRVLGRVSDRIKIGGETVHLTRLEAVLEEEASRLGIASRLTLFASPDPRLENVIHAVLEEGCDSADARKAVAGYNLRVLPFERAREIRSVPAIPRTELGKIKRAELRALLDGPSR